MKTLGRSAHRLAILSFAVIVLSLYGILSGRPVTTLESIALVFFAIALVLLVVVPWDR